MAREQLIERLHSLSKPELRHRSGMVYEVWEDGEITLQKSGDLYGQRNLHMIVPGNPAINVAMPDSRGKHSCMAIADADVVEARAILHQLYDLTDRYADVLPGQTTSTQELFAQITERNKRILESE